jgi:putative YjhG/YagF family dehydratase
MMMALAGMRELPCILVPGGATLPPTIGEDAGKIQTIGTRYAHGLITLDEAAEAACHACASPGGGCQFLGTAATSQVVAEAIGLTLPHAALAPSGQRVWLELATKSARALLNLDAQKLTTSQIVTEASIRNAMVIHAAFGGSTNLLLHIPAIAHSAGLPRPTVQEWAEINRKTPRIVDALPNGPVGHPTVRVFLAGGVPEVMLHLRELSLINESCMTASGETWRAVLDWWRTCERRKRFREVLERESINPDDVIMSPARAVERGLTPTLVFPTGNLAPQGSVIKSTAIDPTVVGSDGIFRMTGPARVFVSEPDAVAAIKAGAIKAGDVLVLICAGPMGAGMQEIYQVTSALRYLPFGKHVAVLTDGRFSGVSTGACVGHIGPEALAGGPIGKLIDGDLIRIVIDRKRLVGSIDFVGTREKELSADEGAQLLAHRSPRADLRPHPSLPDDTRLWATLQAASGGAWGGCVYDADAIGRRLHTSEH